VNPPIEPSTNLVVWKSGLHRYLFKKKSAGEGIWTPL